MLPHALEFTSDPHQLLREAYRAMRCKTDQGVVASFNPVRLFGAKRYFGRGLTPPWNGNFIGLYRLKDWLGLLGLEVTGGAPGLLRAALRQRNVACAVRDLRGRR